MRRLRLALCLTALALLALPASAMAGRLWATGHDADFHCGGGGGGPNSGQCHYLLTAVAYVRAAAPDPTKKVLVLDNFHKLLDTDLTNLGVAHDTVDPSSAGFATMPLSTSTYSAILVASDASCGGCDLNETATTTSQTPDSDAINARKSDIAAFFNAGGGVLALAGADHGGAGSPSEPDDYYDFLPLPVGGTPVSGPFCLTSVGKALSLFDTGCPDSTRRNPGPSEDLQYATHNSFNLPASGSSIQVAETDSTGKAETLIAEGAISGGAVKHPTATGVGCSPDPFAGSTTCTALVGDTASNPTAATGTVAFSTDAGSFSGGGSCTLGSNGACSVTYTQPPGETAKSHTITATYGGDSGHLSSSSHVTVTELGGPQVAPTASLPPPVLGKTADVFVKSGTVRVKLPGSDHFVTLTAGEQIPYGSTIDTTQGTVTMVNATPGGGTQSGNFNGGQFVLTQDMTGLVTLSLTGGGLAPARAAGVDPRVVAARSSRHVWGNSHGHYRTRGRWASATSRGTHWEVVDTCAGTRVVVLRGTVTVRDRVRHKNVTVHAKHHYLAHAPESVSCAARRPSPRAPSFTG